MKAKRGLAYPASLGSAPTQPDEPGAFEGADHDQEERDQEAGHEEDYEDRVGAKGEGGAPARRGQEAEAKPKQEAQPTAPAQDFPAAAANATPPASPVAKRAPAAPLTRDPRLPAPGTLLQKRDRHGAVRCECTVEKDGVRYAGKIYKSLSAAAMAAAKDLGLTNKTQNGFVFWGLSKPPRQPADPLVALERAWERYHGNVVALVKDGVTDENRSKVLTTIKKHVQTIDSLREKVA